MSRAIARMHKAPLTPITHFPKEGSPTQIRIASRPMQRQSRSNAVAGNLAEDRPIPGERVGTEGVSLRELNPQFFNVPPKTYYERLAK